MRSSKSTTRAARFAAPLLSPEAAQTKRVGHHAHRREGHRPRGDHRAEEPDRGEREGCRVVAEGPAEVLADDAQGTAGQVERRDHAPQVARDEREVGGLYRHVRPGADRDAEVGLSQGGSVVDAVADHGDHPSACLELANFVDLVLRQDLSEHPVDPELTGDRPRGAAVVARDHRHLEPARLQRSRDLRRLVLERVADREGAPSAPRPADEDRGEAERLEAVHLLPERRRHRYPAVSQELAPADVDLDLFDGRLDPVAGQCDEAARTGNGNAVLSREAHHGQGKVAEELTGGPPVRQAHSDARLGPAASPSPTPACRR